MKSVWENIFLVRKAWFEKIILPKKVSVENLIHEHYSAKATLLRFKMDENELLASIEVYKSQVCLK